MERLQDLNIKTAKLEELSELDRVLSSKYLCRRQSILTLLDDPSQPCLETESKCDNCSPIKPPTIRVVTDVVHVAPELP